MAVAAERLRSILEAQQAERHREIQSQFDTGQMSTGFRRVSAEFGALFSRTFPSGGIPALAERNGRPALVAFHDTEQNRYFLLEMHRTTDPVSRRESTSRIVSRFDPNSGEFLRVLMRATEGTPDIQTVSKTITVPKTHRAEEAEKWLQTGGYGYTYQPSTVEAKYTSSSRPLTEPQLREFADTLPASEHDESLTEAAGKQAAIHFVYSETPKKRMALDVPERMRTPFDTSPMDPEYHRLSNVVSNLLDSNEGDIARVNGLEFGIPKLLAYYHEGENTFVLVEDHHTTGRTFIRNISSFNATTGDYSRIRMVAREDGSYHRTSSETGQISTELLPSYRQSWEITGGFELMPPMGSGEAMTSDKVDHLTELLKDSIFQSQNTRKAREHATIFATEFNVAA